MLNFSQLTAEIDWWVWGTPSYFNGRRLDVYTWCGLSVNLECRSETWCTRLAGNAGPKKIAKNLSSRHHRTTLSGYIFTTKTCIENRGKIVKQQYLPHMSSQYGELRPTNGWDPLGEFGAPQQISTGFASWQRYCTAL